MKKLKSIIFQQILDKHQNLVLKSSAMTHLCHDICIRHVQMICIKFTRLGEDRVMICEKHDNYLSQWFNNSLSHRIRVNLSNLFSVRAVRLK